MGWWLGNKRDPIRVSIAVTEISTRIELGMGAMAGMVCEDSRADWRRKPQHRVVTVPFQAWVCPAFRMISEGSSWVARAGENRGSATGTLASAHKTLRDPSHDVQNARVSRKDEELRQQREAAWVGDAVLALFARQFVLRERKTMDGEWFTHLTSNDFLSAFGQPTRVEASIGTIYQEHGLEAAFEWMDTHLIPLFRKQTSAKH